MSTYECDVCKIYRRSRRKFTTESCGTNWLEYHTEPPFPYVQLFASHHTISLLFLTYSPSNDYSLKDFTDSTDLVRTTSNFIVLSHWGPDL